MTFPGTSDRPTSLLASWATHDGGRTGFLPSVAPSESSTAAPIRSTGFAAFRLLGFQSEISAPPPAPLLGDRCAGQAVMAEALRIHDEEPPRSWWGRLVGASPLSPRSRPWFKGAEGELAVGRILARLGPEWTVLHAVPVGAGASDIDHVLIGPAGVFTLNTKNHSGQTVWVGERAVLVAGQKQHHLSHARHEAARAAKRLSAAVGEPVQVTAVLVLVDPKQLTIKQRPAEVNVVTTRRLLRWLQRRRPVLTPEQVERLAAAAVIPRTWHDHPPLPEDPVALQERFAALQACVRTARRRRMLWHLGWRLGGVTALLALGPDLLAAVLNSS